MVFVDILTISKSNCFVPLLEAIINNPVISHEKKNEAIFVIQHIIHLRGFGRKLTDTEQKLINLDKPSDELWNKMSNILDGSMDQCGQTLYSDLVYDAEHDYLQYKNLLSEYNLAHYLRRK